MRNSFHLATKRQNLSICIYEGSAAEDIKNTRAGYFSLVSDSQKTSSVEHQLSLKLTARGWSRASAQIKTILSDGVDEGAARKGCWENLHNLPKIPTENTGKDT